MIYVTWDLLYFKINLEELLGIKFFFFEYKIRGGNKFSLIG